MTPPRSVAVLDFFLVEASDYVERLDLLLRSAGPQGPNVESFARDARALRGSATMFRQEGVARLAQALERVGRALREKSLPWEPGVSGAITAAVDDLRLVLRNARDWGEAEERRVRSRADELERFAPASRATPSALRDELGTTFVASAAASLADALDRLVADPGNHALAGDVQQRVRSLHGVAAIKDVVLLPDAADAIERALAGAEESGAPPGGERELLSAASGALRRAAADLADGRRPSITSEEALRFERALAVASSGSGEESRVIPIAELFFDDGGPTVVSAAPNPPTTPAARFRLEVVSRAEHLRRVVEEARGVRDPAALARISRELRTALHALGRAAQSFGERKVARFIEGWGDRVVSLDIKALTALESAASMLSETEVLDDELRRRLELLAPRNEGADRGKAGTDDRTEGSSKSRTPTGRDLYDFLENGIAGLSRLNDSPLAAPLPLPDEAVIPIDRLLYRGRAALDRAIELRDQIRRRGGSPPRGEIEEIFDLLDLAVGE